MSNPFKLNWKDLDAVREYATSLRPKVALVIFWNGTNYQITHAERMKERVLDRGFVVVSIVNE